MSAWAVARSNSPPRLRSEPERTPEDLPPFARRDPVTMAGEHLPPHEDGEFDLVRIELANLLAVFYHIICES